MATVQCMKSELDLYAPIAIQKDILRSETIVVNPITSLDSTNIDFYCSGNSETYKDLANVYLRLVVELSSEKVNNVDEKDASVVNNLIHSLFSQATVFLNNTCVSQNEGDYAYRCYFEKLLNFGKESADTHLQTGGWFIDGGDVDSLSDNTGLAKRKTWLTNGKKVELFSRLHADIFNQNKYLVSNVDLRVNLVKADEKFYLMGKDADTCKLKILEANLFVDHAYVNPNLIIAHHKLLDNNKFITYPVKRLQMRHYTVQPNIFTLSLENICMGQLPSLLIFGMVSNEAYIGKRSKNCFNFQHFNLSSIQLSANGQLFPSGRPLEMDFNEANPMYAKAYFSMFRALQIHRTDRANQITMENFAKGFSIFVFDLTKDQNYGGMCSSQLSEGSLRLEAKFNKATPNSITALVALEFDGAIQIDQNKTVSVLY